MDDSPETLAQALTRRIIRRYAKTNRNEARPLTPDMLNALRKRLMAEVMQRHPDATLDALCDAFDVRWTQAMRPTRAPAAVPPPATVQPNHAARKAERARMRSRR